MIGAALRMLPPEAAHGLALGGLRAGILRRAPAADPVLETSVGGLHLPNAIGLAAGFDKNAVAHDALLGLGFGFVEVGAVTPRPQAGNPRPRLFRLPRDGAIINRMGFNNAGLAAMRARLSRGRRGVVGVNIGANKDSTDRAGDYVAVIEGLAGLCAFFTINVSSPNTEGLRAMQAAAALDALLERALNARDRAAPRTPVFLKIAPDLDDEAMAAMAAVAMAHGVDGIIATNTTIGLRAGLHGMHAGERGGLSGAPVFELSTRVLRDLARLTQGQMPLIGVGGVDSGAAAYAKIRAGASAVQLYTALVYGGPDLPRRIAADLAALLRRDGYASVAEAVGADAAASSAG